MKPPSPPPLFAPSLDEFDHPILRRTLAQISLVVGMAGLILAVYLYFYSVRATDAIAPALIGLFASAGRGLLARGNLRHVPHLMIIGVLVAASVAVAVYGSLRAAGGVLMLMGAVAAAVIFTSKRFALGATLVTLVLIGALAWAEWRGWMVPRNIPVGLPAVFTYMVCIVVVALVVFYSRRRSEDILLRLHTELDTRQRTEQERDRHLERFARIFRNSPSPMLAQSAHNGAILDVNPAFERCYGYRRDQVLGHSDRMLWADQAERSIYIERLRSLGTLQQEAVTGQRADGSTFDALISSEMGDESDDQLIITTIADVTIQNEAVERLRRSEERFAKAFNFSPLNMTITRLSDGAFIEVNQAKDQTQGMDPRELIGKTSLEVGAWLSAAERQTFVERLQRDGRVHAYETRMRHRDGSLIDARLWAELIELDGETCILSCTVNVSAEKRREALLVNLAQGMNGQTSENLFDSLTQNMATALGADMTGLAELGSDGRMHTLAMHLHGQKVANSAYETHATPCEQTLRQGDIFIIPAGVEDRFPRMSAWANGPFQAYVGQALRDDTGLAIGVLVAMWTRPIAPNPELQPLVSILASRASAELLRARREREIHHLNATLEQRVHKRTAELEKLNTELDSFAYSVSHDLKSPLRAIDGFTRLLDDLLGDRLNDEERQLFSRVLAATQRMSALINDMLALARISQGLLERQHTHLSAMAHEVLQREQERQPLRTLRWHIEPGLYAHCDPRMARIALENLLGNAVKYTRDQPAPFIQFGRDSQTLQEAVFYVRDNGAGFDMAFADKLFKPFQRLHLPSTGFEGTGIGLATVRRIVERHGGHISGTGQPGLGAEFRFSLEPHSPTAKPDAPLT